MAVAAGSDQARRRLCAIAGVDYAGPTNDEAASASLSAALDAAMATKLTSHWLTELRAADVPVVEVRHVEEILFDDHVLAEGLLVDIDHELVGPYRTFGTPIRLSDTPFRADSPSPRFAWHTRSVLAELGFSDDEITALSTAGTIVEGRQIAQ